MQNEIIISFWPDHMKLMLNEIKLQIISFCVDSENAKWNKNYIISKRVVTLHQISCLAGLELPLPRYIKVRGGLCNDKQLWPKTP